MSRLNAESLPTPLRAKPDRNATLRARLTGGNLVMAPGSYDCITARLVELAGFPATYISGSGVSLSALGAPDVGILSFHEILDRVRRICDSMTIPVIADADTGYGGPLNVARTVIEMARAGVSAIQIEDQSWPKKCGHEPNRKLVSIEEMCGRIKAAVDTRPSDDILIIARTDARSDHGIEAAIERGQRFAEAGADVVFVESPESETEMSRIPSEVPGPTMINMVEGGQTPLLPAGHLQELGFQIAIYPNSLTRLFGKVGARLLGQLARDGQTHAMADDMLTHRELWDLFEHPVWTRAEECLS